MNKIDRRSEGGGGPKIVLKDRPEITFVVL